MLTSNEFNNFQTSNGQVLENEKYGTPKSFEHTYDYDGSYKGSSTSGSSPMKFNVRFQNVSMMGCYKDKSFEELRYEDYIFRRDKLKNPLLNQAVPSSQTPTSTSPLSTNCNQMTILGGNTGTLGAQPNTVLFEGPQKQNTGLFGASQSTGVCGASKSTGVCGASQSTGLFGASQSTGLFGASQSAGLFGASQSTGLFGASQSTGLFGASQSTGPFGASQSTGLFGASQNIGLFGAPQNTGIFGAQTNTGAFRSQPNTGPSVARPNTVPFVAQQNPGILFGAQQYPGFFGTQTNTGLFGTQYPATQPFPYVPLGNATTINGNNIPFGSLPAETTHTVWNTHTANTPFNSSPSGWNPNGPSLFGQSSQTNPNTWNINQNPLQTSYPTNFPGINQNAFPNPPGTAPIIQPPYFFPTPNNAFNANNFSSPPTSVVLPHVTPFGTGLQVHPWGTPNPPQPIPQWGQTPSQTPNSFFQGNNTR